VLLDWFLENDNKYAGEWLDQAIKTQRWFLENNYDKDGMYTESFMYSSYALSSAALFFQALFDIKGIDLMSYNDNTFLKATYAAMYFFDPGKQNAAPFDDETRWGIPSRYRYVGIGTYWFLAAAHFDDPILQRFLRTMYGDLKFTERLHDYAGYLPRALLSFKEVDDSVSIDDQGLPLSKVYPEFGRVVMRTGFEGQEDYYFAMQSGLYGSHSQADQSSFIIHALGRLLVDENT